MRLPFFSPVEIVSPFRLWGPDGIANIGYAFRTLHLTKNSEGHFSATAQLPSSHKTLYKYVVDGNWQHNADEAHETDDSNNVNNVVEAPAVAAAPVSGIAGVAGAESHNTTGGDKGPVDEHTAVVAAGETHDTTAKDVVPPVVAETAARELAPMFPPALF